MNRQQFNSRNDIGEVLTFQKSGTTSSFDPSVSFASGLRRVSWRLDNGTNIEQTAGNGLTYTGFTSDTGIRTIEMRGNSFMNMSIFDTNNDNIYGNLNLSPLKSFSNGSSIILFSNPNLTGITNPSVGNTFNNYNLNSSGLIGNLDMSPISGNISSFIIHTNPTLTSITHNNVSAVISQYVAYGCNLTGNLDLPFSGLGTVFQVFSNQNLTGITHAPSDKNFTQYSAQSCNLTGNLDLTPLSGLGGNFRINNNINLTGITHTYSPTSFTNYNVTSCNLIGNLDLTMFPNLGGTLQFSQNTNLTGITHTASTQNITLYVAQNCELTGNHNLSWFSNLGGVVSINGNLLLTSITHTASTKNFTQYNIHQNNITGTHDISMFSNFGGASTASTCYVTLYINPNLTDITFPTTNGYFKNFVNTESQSALGLYSCNLNYVDFKPLSGATFLTGTTQGNPRISLRDNGMIADDVNHILVDFSGNTISNPSGWSNINLNIGGTNADPDSSSGGYDGLAAISFLTGSPYNWTITY